MRRALENTALCSGLEIDGMQIVQPTFVGGLVNLERFRVDPLGLPLDRICLPYLAIFLDPRVRAEYESSKLLAILVEANKHTVVRIGDAESVRLIIQVASLADPARLVNDSLHSVSFLLDTVHRAVLLIIVLVEIEIDIEELLVSNELAHGTAVKEVLEQGFCSPLYLIPGRKTVPIYHFWLSVQHVEGRIFDNIGHKLMINLLLSTELIVHVISQCRAQREQHSGKVRSLLPQANGEQFGCGGLLLSIVLILKQRLIVVKTLFEHLQN